MMLSGRNLKMSFTRRMLSRITKMTHTRRTLCRINSKVAFTRRKLSRNLTMTFTRKRHVVVLLHDVAELLRGIYGGPTSGSIWPRRRVGRCGTNTRCLKMDLSMMSLMKITRLSVVLLLDVAELHGGIYGRPTSGSIRPRRRVGRCGMNTRCLKMNLFMRSLKKSTRPAVGHLLAVAELLGGIYGRPTSGRLWPRRLDGRCGMNTRSLKMNLSMMSLKKSTRKLTDVRSITRSTRSGRRASGQNCR